MGPEKEADELNQLMKRQKTFNRADRRRKPINDPTFTKSTHKMKKERKKNAPSKQQRQRTIAQARKARKESYTQVS